MKIAVLPGDDIGPEITDATLDVLKKLDTPYALGLDLEIHEIGKARHKTSGTTLPDSVIDATLSADGTIMGPASLSTYPPVKDGGLKVPAVIRKAMNLHANIRPARARKGVAMARPGLDCVIVRENTEGFFADRNLYAGHGEFMPVQGVAMSLRLITEKASRRIARDAFELARERRRQVAVVGKWNVLTMTDGLFIESVESVARDFPDVTLRKVQIDATAAELYTGPQAFDVILATNMLGDILSNLANALAGSLGLAASLNASETRACANSAHGTAPDIAGKGIANPVGLMHSAAMLLQWLGRKRDAENYSAAGLAMSTAIDATIEEDGVRTGDLGGTARTADFAKAVCNRI